jgi:hypothetical protein
MMRLRRLIASLAGAGILAIYLIASILGPGEVGRRRSP